MNIGNTFQNSRLAKAINYILLLLTVGSSMFFISIINTKDTYLEILESSNKENSAEAISLANMILSMPMFVLTILFIFALVGKEFLLKSNFTKLKLNAASAVVLLAFCVLVLQILSYPAA